MRIIFHSLPVGLDQSFLRKVIASVLKKENKPKAVVEIIFLSKKEIAKLNFQYRGSKGATDILSFPQTRPFPREDKDLLGELAICFACVKENTLRFKEPLSRELSRTLIHGVLHLLGYNHEKDKTMLIRQEGYLAKLHFNPKAL